MELMVAEVLYHTFQCLEIKEKISKIAYIVFNFNFAGELSLWMFMLVACGLLQQYIVVSNIICGQMYNTKDAASLLACVLNKNLLNFYFSHGFFSEVYLD